MAKITTSDKKCKKRCKWEQNGKTDILGPNPPRPPSANHNPGTPIPTTRTIEPPGASTEDILAEIGWTD